MKKLPFHLSRQRLSAAALCLAAGFFLPFSALPAARSAQLASLLIPFGLFFALSPRRPGWVRAAAAFFLAACLLSCADSALRGFLMASYESDYFSGFVIQALANTSPQEAREYLATAQPQILFWAGAGLVVFLIQAALILSSLRRSLPLGCSLPQRPGDFRPGLPSGAALCLAAAAVAGLTLFNHSWRSHMVPLSWIKAAACAESYRDFWRQSDDRNAEIVRVSQSLITHVGDTPKTIVLVIGESLTRDNMSLFGYSRDTTPELRGMVQKGEITAVADSWSTAAQTIAAFESMFHFPAGQAQLQGRGNLFAFIRAAGFRIIWISNQDDLAIKELYQDYADKAVLLNRVSGRSTRSMDEKLLQPLSAAMQDPAPRKLIVVHMLGAHPHFALRYPDRLKDAWSGSDSVSRSMEKLGRGPIVRGQLNDYDRAMLYQDEVLARIFRIVRDGAGNRSTLCLFLSDHGVETGRYDNRVGHSPSSPSSYRIPVLLWARGPLEQAVRKAAERPFRADWTDSLLLDAAEIRWKGERPHESLLNPDYRWSEPESRRRFSSALSRDSVR